MTGVDPNGFINEMMPNLKTCDVCKEEIDNEVKNSLTIQAGDNKFTVCEDCAKQLK